MTIQKLKSNFLNSDVKMCVFKESLKKNIIPLVSAKQKIIELNKLFMILC